ncbi:MAG TPA: prolyl oligopeptidase family serine peptidase [Pseudomonadales bacterium]|nr:prolyl oligopeptidase family serine peptidase [Pseudomonadales bacterium]
MRCRPFVPLLLIALVALVPALPVAAAPAADWPFPQDTPEPVAPVLDLAGSEPADVIRFLMVRGPYAAAMSPNGDWVAYRDRVTGTPQLWVVPAAGGPARQLTFGRSVTTHRWHPDGTAILYATDRGGNERESYTLISVDGTRETEVIAYHEAFIRFGDFAPSGGQVTFSSTARNGTDFDVYVGDVATGEYERVHDGVAGLYARAWQPGGGNIILTQTRGADARDVYLLGTRSRERVPLFVPDEATSYDDFQWLPDGSGFYLTTDADREFDALAFHDLDSGRTEIVAAPDWDVDDVTLFGDGRYLAWTVNENGYDRVAVLDRERGEQLELPALPPGVYSLSGADHAPMLSIGLRGPRNAAETFTLNVETGAVAQVGFTTWAGLEPASMAVPETVSFPARDGVMLHGLMFLPEAKSEDAPPPPMVLMVHGGPTSQARPDFDATAQYLVQRGIAVFDLNFRGSTGYGKTFTRLDDMRLRPDAVRDMADAMAFLAEDGRVDASRAAVMGGSYGGYLTNAAMGAYPQLFDVGVSFVGVSDWVRALEEASPALKASDRLEYGDIDDPDDRAFFREISPITNADRIRGAMVFVHGVNDPRDPVTESDRMVRQVRANGVDVVYLRWPDEGHSIRKLGNRVATYRVIADFLNEKLEVSR